MMKMTYLFHIFYFIIKYWFQIFFSLIVIYFMFFYIQNLKKENDEKIQKLQKKNDKLQKKNNKRIKKLHEKIEKLQNDISNNKDKFKSDNKILKKKLYYHEQEIKHCNVKLLLMNELMNSEEKSNNMKLDISNKKYDYLVNCFKILIYRKIANSILEELITKNKNKLYKTENIFIDKSKPQPLQKEFPIIVARESINTITINNINLVIDFLMFIKDKCSDIIHISDKEIVFILDLMVEILGEGAVKGDRLEEQYLESKEVFQLLFDESNYKADKESIIIEKRNEVEKGKDNIYIKIIEELEKFKMNQEIEVKNDNKKINIEASKESLNNNGNSSESNGNGNTISTLNNASNGNVKTISTLNNTGNDSPTLFENIKELLSSDLDKKEHFISLIKDEISLSHKINEYNDIINSLSELSTIQNNKNIYKIEYFYELWIKSFESGYKSEKNFKALVFMEKNIISLDEIKKALVLLVPHIKIKIFKEDAAKFPSMVDKIIKRSQIKNFYKDKK